MTINQRELKSLLERIDANLTSEQTICLIGSGATILLGQPSRATEDLDVWLNASKIDVPMLKHATEAAGLSFDPKYDFPTLPYVQIVHPGIVQVPGWSAATNTWFGKPSRPLWSGRYLQVTCPPAEVIVASKLVRGNDRDLEDCLWLMTAHGLDAKAVLAAIKKLPEPHKEAASGNLDLLKYLKR